MFIFDATKIEKNFDIKNFFAFFLFFFVTSFLFFRKPPFFNTFALLEQFADAPKR